VPLPASDEGLLALARPGDAGAGRLARSITAGLLPSRRRKAYGLAWDATREARLDALVASVHSLREDAGRVA